MKSFLNKPFSHGIRKAAILTAAIASLAAASASWAAPITIKHSSTTGETGEITKRSPSPTFTDMDVRAGKFNFNVITSPDTAKWNNTLQAFCTDVDNDLLKGTNVTYDIVAATTASSGWSSLQLAQVSWLFDTQYGSLGNSTVNNAAFQLTLWEILFEKGTIGFSLNEDNNSPRKSTFWADTSFNGARTMANTMLSGISGVTAAYTSTTWDLYVLKSPFECSKYDKNGVCTKWGDQISQNLITALARDPRNPNEVSEPGTLLLLSIGLGGILFSIRRRNGLQFASLA